MNISKDNKKLFIITFFSLIFSFISALSTNLFLTLILLSLSIFIFFIATKSRYTLLLKTFAFFVLFHFVLFPYLYVILIKIDSKAFQIDSEIEKNELIIAEQELNEKYEITNLSKRENILKKMLASKSTYLDSTFNYLNNDNILIIDSLLFHKSYIYKKGGNRPRLYSTLSICNSKGKSIINLIGDYGDNISSDLTLKQFFNNQMKTIKTTNHKLIIDKDKIEEKDIWSYKRILAYSINIFETDNIKPKTKVANILFFIHRFLVAIFILGIIGTSFYELIEGKKKN